MDLWGADPTQLGLFAPPDTTLENLRTALRPYRNADGIYQCPCCTTRATLDHLIADDHVSLQDPRTWSDRMYACQWQRRQLSRAVETCRHGLPAEYTEMATIDPQGRPRCHWTELMGNHPTMPVWQCPICEGTELSPVRLAWGHGIDPWDRSTWERDRCWHVTAETEEAWCAQHGIEDMS